MKLSTTVFAILGIAITSVAGAAVRSSKNLNLLLAVSGAHHLYLVKAHEFTSHVIIVPRTLATMPRIVRMLAVTEVANHMERCAMLIQLFLAGECNPYVL
jgi:hypothetical protein